MEIVVCLDKWYVVPTGVLMYSVCANNQDADITFHVLVDESVNQKAKSDLRDTVEGFANKQVIFYNIDSHLIDSFPGRKILTITQASYYRLFLTEIVSQNVNKILYLDGDTIVRHSLKSLWETDLTNYALAAVTDMSSGNIEFYNRLNYPFECGYFNSGVLLINLKWWREKGVLNKFVDYIANYYERIKLQDQDVLNVVFSNQIKFLPVTYNFQHGFLLKKPSYDFGKYEKEIEETRKDPTIVHYTLGKPWEKMILDVHPFSSTFIKYQMQTIWRNCKKNDRRTINQKIRMYISQILRLLRIRPKSIFIDINPLDLL